MWGEHIAKYVFAVLTSGVESESGWSKLPQGITVPFVFWSVVDCSKHDSDGSGCSSQSDVCLTLFGERAGLVSGRPVQEADAVARLDFEARVGAAVADGYIELSREELSDGPQIWRGRRAVSLGTPGIITRTISLRRGSRRKEESFVRELARLLSEAKPGYPGLSPMPDVSRA